MLKDANLNIGKELTLDAFPNLKNELTNETKSIKYSLMLACPHALNQL